MILTEDQAYILLYKESKRKGQRRRYKFRSKTKWRCISCGCTIYVSYKQYGRNSIFCDNCFKTAIPVTVVQLNYMKRLKDEQLKLIESFSNSMNNELEINPIINNHE